MNPADDKLRFFTATTLKTRAHCLSMVLWAKNTNPTVFKLQLFVKLIYSVVETDVNIMDYDSDVMPAICRHSQLCATISM